MEDNPINIHQQNDHNGQRDHTKTSKNSISSIDRRGQEDGSPSNDNQYYRNNNNGMMFHDNNNNYYYSNENGNDDYINERRIQQHHYDNHSDDDNRETNQNRYPNDSWREDRHRNSRGGRGYELNREKYESMDYRRNEDKDYYSRRSNNEYRRGDYKDERGDRFRGSRRKDTSYDRYRNDYHGRAKGNDDYKKRRRLSEDEDYYNQRRDSRHNHPRNDKRRRDRHSDAMRNKKVEWPSPFEESGGNYVFDARSGLFYEAVSDYFYDPKNKLYYSNEKKIYYRYCPKPIENSDDKRASDESSAWEEVKPGQDGIVSGITTAIQDADGQRTVDEGGISQDLVVQALQGSNVTNMTSKQGKKKINICIKKKFKNSVPSGAQKLNLENQASNSPILNTMQEKQSLVQKAHDANIAKWSATKRDELIATDSCTPNKSIDDSSNKIKMTKAGKPICWVCKRKFANIEKLKEHEKLSALHQQNLANQKRIEEAKNIEYRDRASERRSMYEADLNNAVAPIDPSIVNMGPSLDKARTVTTTEKVTPDQTLGESSVGNKLLQKLGWKSGESLGRNRGDESESTSKLKKDWEMIEHLSGSKS